MKVELEIAGVKVRGRAGRAARASTPARSHELAPVHHAELETGRSKFNAAQIQEFRPRRACATTRNKQQRRSG